MSTAADAKAEFFAEVSAWGTLLEQRRQGTTSEGLQTAPSDPEADWRLATKVLRAGRIFIGYKYLFMFIGVICVGLALLGAVLMAQKVAA